MTIVHQTDRLGRNLYYRIDSNGVKRRIAKNKLTSSQIKNAKVHTQNKSGSSVRKPKTLRRRNTVNRASTTRRTKSKTSNTSPRNKVKSNDNSNLLEEILKECKINMEHKLAKKEPYTQDDFMFDYVGPMVSRVVKKHTKNMSVEQLDNVIRNSEIREFQTYKMNKLNKELAVNLITNYINNYTDLLEGWNTPNARPN